MPPRFVLRLEMIVQTAQAFRLLQAQVEQSHQLTGLVAGCRTGGASGQMIADRVRLRRVAFLGGVQVEPLRHIGAG